MENKNLAIGYSSKCSNNCNHCLVSPVFKKEEKFDIIFLKKIIKDASEIGIKVISFTFGEPLIYLDEMIYLIKYCKLLDIKTRIVTNAFFATSSESANKVIKNLKKAGLSELKISSSRFHQKKIPFQNIFFASQSCKKNNLSNFVSFCTDFSNDDIFLKNFLESNNLNYSFEPLVYFGNAKNIRKSGNIDYKNKCDLIPLITPDSKVYACCGPGLYFGKTNFFYIGDLKKNDLKSIYEKFLTNKIYDLIRTKGLDYVASVLNISVSDEQLKGCHLCEKIFNSEKNISILYKMLSSKVEEIAGFKFIRRMNSMITPSAKDDYLKEKINNLDKLKLKKIKLILLNNLQSYPKNETYWAALGYICLCLEKNESAKKCFSKCIEINPLNIDNWIDIALADGKIGNLNIKNNVFMEHVSLVKKHCLIYKQNYDDILKVIYNYKNSKDSFKYSPVITNLDENLVSVTKPINNKNSKRLLFINPPIEEPLLIPKDKNILNKIKILNKYTDITKNLSLDGLIKSYSYNLPIGLLKVAKKKHIEGNEIVFLDCFASLPNHFKNSKINAKKTSHIIKNFSKNWSLQYYHLGLSYKDIGLLLKKLGGFDEIYVGCTFTYHNESAHKVISICKTIFPNSKVIFGGIYPSLAPEEAKKSNADEVFEGKYPETESLPIDYTILGYVPYYSLIKGTSGCPNNCAYCAVHKLEGNKFCYRNPKDVFSEIIFLYNKYWIRNIAIWDSNLLLCYNSYFGKLLTLIRGDMSNTEIFAPEGLDYRLISEEIAKDLKKSGFTEISIALENIDIALSKKSLNRFNDLEKFKQVISLLKSVGFSGKINVFIIVGLPGQSFNDLVKNIKFVWALGCNVQFFPFTPIPGTKIYDDNIEFLKDKKLKELHPFFFTFVKHKDFFIELLILNYFIMSNLSQKKNASKVLSRKLFAYLES